MDSLALATSTAQILDSKKALDIEILKIEDLTTITDYFVIATGTSTTQIKALAGEVEVKLKEQGVTPLHVEGYDSATWILLDYGSVIVHIFHKESRAFYSLERLWSDAQKVSLEDILK